jgi:hypothetical protein
MRSKLIKPNNGPEYWIGIKSISKKPIKITNFRFKKWWKKGLYRSDRFFIDFTNLTFGEFITYNK